MSRFDDQIARQANKALNAASDTTSGRWQILVETLNHDVRDGFIEVMKTDAVLEHELTTAPLAEQQHVAKTINVYWRSQAAHCELPAAPDLREEVASRAELLAARIAYEMLKLRGHHRAPTILDLFRSLR